MTIATENPKITMELSPRQAEALSVLEDPETQELMYGGAKGGGKSVFLCYYAYRLCKQLIQMFDLPVRKYPLVAGFMGRKQGVDFNATTLVTWKKMIPEDAYLIREIEKVRYIVIEGKIAIQIGGMDRTETVNKFNSAEYAFYCLDQAEELTRDEIGLIRGTRRLKINGEPVVYKGLLTANPAICFLKDDFIDNPAKGNRFVQALPGDNPFLAPGYIEQLRKAFGHKPELLKAYLEGSWDDLDAANVIINYKHVRNCVNNDQHDKTVIKKITVCDVSEGGGNDECVIYDMVNTKIVNQEIYNWNSPMDTCGRIQAHARKNGSNLIAIDKIGSGNGVYARLVEVYSEGEGDEMTVYGYDSRLSGKDLGTADGTTFHNRKAASWWKAGIMFAEGLCDIPNDPKLINQLAGVTYHFLSNMKIIVDDKEKVIKPKLGCSPDRAEAYIIGLDALEIAEPVSKPDAYMRENEGDYDFSPETC